MGLYDRDYTQQNWKSGYPSGPRMRMGFSKPTQAVKWLLIINFAVFFIGLIVKPIGNLLYNVGEVNTTSWITSIQAWRLITYQFLHDPNRFAHIFFNMLGLFFLGPTLERHWGTKRFLTFYFSCGAIGGIFYTLLVAVGYLPEGHLVGASGAILGLLAACAILFPHFVVFILFFPVPIRLAAVGLTLFYIFAIITRSANAGGEAAHLAGMAAGIVYVLWKPITGRFWEKSKQRTWEKKHAELVNLKKEVDRVLEKVHNHGIQSLTRKEKSILKKATELEKNTRS